jgi:peptidoglycan/xylan/chitin deacetylase (PgdA/CDA1 family)
VPGSDELNCRLGRGGFVKERDDGIKVKGSTAKRLWRSAFRNTPSALIEGLAPSGLLAPLYHTVSDHPPAHVRHLYRCRGIKQFRDELNLLLKQFRPVSLEELAHYILAQEPLPRHSLFLSFDDGLRECIEYVAPVCRAKGVPVTFFLASAFIGNRTLCFRHKASLLIEKCSRRPEQATGIRADGRTFNCFEDLRAFVFGVQYKDAHLLDDIARQLEVDFDDYLRRERPYLDEEDVHSLTNQGFSIGGHSVDHPPYAQITLEEQLSQTADCMRNLKAAFSMPISPFAFPFTADGVSDEFIRQAFGSGSVDMMFYTGSLRSRRDNRVIWRFGVESVDLPLIDFWKNEIASQQWQRLRRFTRRLGFLT